MHLEQRRAVYPCAAAISRTGLGLELLGHAFVDEGAALIDGAKALLAFDLHPAVDAGLRQRIGANLARLAVAAGGGGHRTATRAAADARMTRGRRACWGGQNGG